MNRFVFVCWIYYSLEPISNLQQFGGKFEKSVFLDRNTSTEEIQIGPRTTILVLIDSSPRAGFIVPLAMWRRRRRVGANRQSGGGVLSIQYTYWSVCVCVWVCPELCSAKTEPNELKFGTLTMSGIRMLQPLQALAAMQVVGVGSENGRGGHENWCKFTSEVNY